MIRNRFLSFAAFALAFSLTACADLSTLTDQRMNSVVLRAPYAVRNDAQALHDRLFIADLHDDALLWSRDLLRRYDYGHTDLPRLKEGKVSLQVFATVTKTPRGQNFQRNAADTDNITLLAKVQRWPERTWDSLLQRALYQSEKLHQAASDSDGKLIIVRNQATLNQLSDNLAPRDERLLALLATEGLHPLEGKMDNLDRLYDAGFRITGLTHFFDNEVGGSAHGWDKGGITSFGRQVVQRLNEKSIIIDLAHASPALIDDVLSLTRKPVIVSHTGVQGTCPGPRNLSDAQLRAIGRNGGIVGIGFFEGALCAMTPHGIARAIRHAVSIAGIQHVALGSDFDGATRAVFDARGMPLLTQALMDEGFNDQEIADLMGHNVLRFLKNNLPP